MIAPLTKKRLKTGACYERRPEVLSELEEIITETPVTWAKRAAVADRKTPGYLSTEALTHLFREAHRRDETRARDEILTRLMDRCMAILENNVSNSLRHAEDIRQNVLNDFVDLCLADSGVGDKLDYYEVNFNDAFRVLRVGRVRSALVQNGRETTLSELDKFSPDTPPGEIYAALTKVHHSASEQDIALTRRRVWEAINKLPLDERDVITLQMAGYQIESKDPKKTTIAKRCGCDPRTVQNRLDRAHAKLAKALKEE